jgi:hypothetical protein
MASFSYFRPEGFAYPIGLSTELQDGTINLAKTTTGGTQTVDGTNAIHTFTSSGDFTPSAELNVEYLVIGGGGAGGSGLGARSGGGGGGAGGLSYGFATFPAVTHTCNVGGGAAQAAQSENPTAGSSSHVSRSSPSANVIISLGGGYGGSVHTGVADEDGGAGGSGGGGQGPGRSGGATSNSTQGSAGGAGGGAPNYQGGGGGGAGGAGVAAAGTGTAGGKGGIGVHFSISGSNTGYAGGGGGGPYAGRAPGAGTWVGGGPFGGGNSSTSAAATDFGDAGLANRGGGGGAGQSGTNAPPSSGGGAGGSGVVILRYVMATPGQQAFYDIGGRTGGPAS